MIKPYPSRDLATALRAMRCGPRSRYGLSYREVVLRRRPRSTLERQIAFGHPRAAKPSKEKGRDGPVRVIRYRFGRDRLSTNVRFASISMEQNFCSSIHN